VKTLTEISDENADSAWHKPHLFFFKHDLKEIGDLKKVFFFHRFFELGHLTNSVILRIEEANERRFILIEERLNQGVSCYLEGHTSL
jgi:hypothetical protein